MARIIVALIGGVLLGMFATLVAFRITASINQPPEEIVRDIAAVPQMPQAVAEKHRDEQYANLTSVEEVLSLPTEFARREALYALAGRSGSAALQNLIFGANRIADDVQRIEMLEVLFFRLAEMDAQSALALARTDHFKASKSIEEVVWRAWARKDLDDALFAAKTQVSSAQQNSAAQSLYAAFGYMGNANTDKIEAELGIGPDRTTRSRYLNQLADRSPADAIAFINGLDSGIDQREYVSWLANYLSQNDPSAALAYANQFADAAHSNYYSNIINSKVARDNPKETIERLLAGGRDRRSSSEFHNAIRALASTDLEAVVQYYGQARSLDDRRIFGAVIGAEMAKKDPAAALTWARANDKEQFPYLQMSVLGQIAGTDPEIALAEALNTPNPQMRSNMVNTVMQHIVQTNPASAVAYLDQIQDAQQKRQASQQLVSSWIRMDPAATIDWIVTQDKKTAADMLYQAGSVLLRSDIDAAIQMLPKIDEGHQVSMRQQIAESLATMRSPAEAQNFIQQFDGQPGYAQLQAAVIAGVAQSDVAMARQLADQLADRDARDTAYVQVITQRAQTDPVEAAAWLGSVSNEGMRGAAAAQVAVQWNALDPAAAERWVSNLPAGSSRDDAIMHLSSNWGDPTAAQNDLIASIDDRDKRGQAKMRRIYNVMQTDPVKARKLLEDEDISSYQRQQAEIMFGQRRVRY